MGIENMRRWPMYVLFAVCILLILSLLNSWSMESALQNKVIEVSVQLQECTKQQTSCIEESLKLVEQRDTQLEEMGRQKEQLNNKNKEYKVKLAKSEIQVNRTLVDVEFCKTELQSLKNLQVSKSATLETLRLEKDTLTAQLAERKQKIEDLEKEIERLKSALTTKSALSLSKVTPAAQPPKLSPALNPNNPLNEPVLENNAKEELEDPNDFDQQLQ